MSSTTLAEAPPKPAPTIKSMLLGPQMREQIAMALPDYLTPERFIRIALTALSKTPKLAECTQVSFFKSLLDLAAVGLEPDGRNAHLIPYGTECKLVIDWKGYVRLAKGSGEVRKWRPELVCEKDVFSWIDGVIHHVIDWREDRGAVQLAYSQVTLANGEIDNDVMTLAEVKAIQKRSPAGNSGPWVTDFNEMMKKTPMRRHSKRLNISPAFDRALEVDGDEFTEKQATGREIQSARPQLFAPTTVTPFPLDSLPPAIPGTSAGSNDAASSSNGAVGNDSVAGADGPANDPSRPASDRDKAGDGDSPSGGTAGESARKEPTSPPATEPPASGKTPARRTAKAETLTLDNADTETCKERLERRINQFSLDRFKVEETVKALCRCEYDDLSEEQCSKVLKDFDSLKEACAA